MFFAFCVFLVRYPLRLLAVSNMCAIIDGEYYICWPDRQEHRHRTARESAHNREERQQTTPLPSKKRGLSAAYAASEYDAKYPRYALRVESTGDTVNQGVRRDARTDTRGGGRGRQKGNEDT